jgi:lipoteichoic acid synthase
VGALRLLRSDVLFDLGYVLLWIGLFAASRGMLRRIVFVLFHAAAVLIVVVGMCAYKYFRSTGTTLDYPIVAYYLAKLGEAKGAASTARRTLCESVTSSAMPYALSEGRRTSSSNRSARRAVALRPRHRARAPPPRSPARTRTSPR